MLKHKVLTSKTLLPAEFMNVFLMGYYISTFQFSLLQMGEQLALSNTQIGIIVGLNYGGQILIPILFGYLSDRKGKKGFLLIACALLLSGQALLFAANGFLVMATATFLAGSGFGAMQALGLSMVADIYPNQITRYTNFTQTVFGVGAFLGPLLAAGMEGRGIAWQQAFWPSIILLCVSMTLLCFTKDTRPRKIYVEGNVPAAKPTNVFKSPVFYIVLIWMMCYMGAEMPLASYAKAFMVQQLDAPAYSALVISLFWIMMVPSRILMGMAKKNHARIATVLSGLLVVDLVAIALVKNPVVSVGLFAVAGLLCGPIWPTIFAASQEAFPQATATVGSFCNAMGGFGGFLFPALFGFISEKNSLVVVYLSIAVVAAACFIFAILYIVFEKRARRKDAAAHIHECGGHVPSV